MALPALRGPALGCFLAGLELRFAVAVLRDATVFFFPPLRDEAAGFFVTFFAMA
jgi:hypothetical protein